MSQLDPRFLHPLSVCQRGYVWQVNIAFRVRNHLVPCTTRRKKTLRKRMRRPLSPQLSELLDIWAEADDVFEQGGYLTMSRAEFEFFEKHVKPRIGQPPIYGSTSST